MSSISATSTADFSTIARGLGTVVSYSPGDVLFNEGDTPAFMYFVLKGRIDVTSHGKFIETIEAGRPLGTVSMIDRNPRSASARAAEPSEVALIDERKFRFMVEEIPNFVWFVMNVLVTRLRATNNAL